jgi:hypothetical protein
MAECKVDDMDLETLVAIVEGKVNLKEDVLEIVKDTDGWKVYIRTRGTTSEEKVGVPNLKQALTDFLIIC